MQFFTQQQLILFKWEPRPYVEARFNMINHKIINLGDPTDDIDAVNEQFFEQEIQISHIKPSHKTDQFSYLMQNTQEWSDVTPGGNSFNLTNIAYLSPEQNNIHPSNHKVIYTTMIKNSKGGYGYKMGIQFFRLPKEVDCTLCIEIQITDYRLWHKSRISVDKATSKELTIENVVVKKLSHRYANLSDSIEFMYYHRVIVNLRKLRQTYYTSSIC